MWMQANLQPAAWNDLQAAYGSEQRLQAALKQMQLIMAGK
jgi:hypothetical protein